MGSLTHQTVNYVKGAGAGVEKRILDQIKALKHYVHCCVDTGKVVEFTLSANDAATGNWQTITPGTGIEVIAAPGPGQVNIVDSMVVELTTTSPGVPVDITNGGAVNPSLTLHQVGGGAAITGTLDLSAASGIITQEIGFAKRSSAALDVYIENTGIILDSTAAIIALLPAGATATAKIKIYYKTVSFA